MRLRETSMMLSDHTPPSHLLSRPRPRYSYSPLDITTTTILLLTSYHDHTTTSHLCHDHDHATPTHLLTRPRYSYTSSRHMLILLTSCHYQHHMSSQDICWSYTQDVCMLVMVTRGMLLLPRSLMMLLVTTSSTPSLSHSFKGSYLT